MSNIVELKVIINSKEFDAFENLMKKYPHYMQRFHDRIISNIPAIWNEIISEDKFNKLQDNEKENYTVYAIYMIHHNLIKILKNKN